jgi:hypothetical protein
MIAPIRHLNGPTPIRSPFTSPASLTTPAPPLTPFAHGHSASIKEKDNYSDRPWKKAVAALLFIEGRSASIAVLGRLRVHRGTRVKGR